MKKTMPSNLGICSNLDAHHQTIIIYKVNLSISIPLLGAYSMPDGGAHSKNRGLNIYRLIWYAISTISVAARAHVHSHPNDEVTEEKHVYSHKIK